MTECTKDSPVDTASNVSTDTTLSWNTTTNVDSFDYCIDTSDDDTCNTSWISTSTDLFVDLTGLDYLTTYYWQVRAVNTVGYTYADSNAWRSFTTWIAPPGAFSKTAPSDSATDQDDDLNLAWGDSTDVVSYEYCIDQSNDTVCDSSWTSTDLFTFQGLLDLTPGATYYWQVRANNTTSDALATPTYADSGVWWSFTVINLPDAFTKSEPVMPATDQLLSITLSWHHSVYSEYYEYCYDTNDNDSCDDTWTSTGITSTAQHASVTISGLSTGTTYYWQARAVNAAGETEADSGTWWSFTTQNLPAAFGKANPTDALTDVSIDPTLSWDASASDADAYEYCIDQSADTTCDGGWTDNGTNTSIALSGLTNATTYYWHVRAVNEVGYTYSDTDAWWSFTTIAP
jgi:hypothetical protein